MKLTVILKLTVCCFALLCQVPTSSRRCCRCSVRSKCHDLRKRTGHWYKGIIGEMIHSRVLDMNDHVKLVKLVKAIALRDRQPYFLLHSLWREHFEGISSL